MLKGHPPPHGGRQGSEVPSPPCLTGQNEELRLPLTELQSGAEGTSLSTQLRREENAFPFSALNPSHTPTQGAPSQCWGRGTS